MMFQVMFFIMQTLQKLICSTRCTTTLSQLIACIKKKKKNNNSKNNNKPRPYVWLQGAKKLIYAFVLSCLNYCNALLTGHPTNTKNKLQLEQKEAETILILKAK